jgi:DNA polymerase elongation subunit (family B)
MIVKDVLVAGFYTSVARHFDDLLIRGYENGKRFSRKIKYKPYLFTPSRDGNGEYYTLDSRRVDRIDFESMSECNQFIKRYKDVQGFKMYGLSSFQYAFINDEYREDIVFDKSLVSVLTIDIETDSKGGFPNIDTADKMITAITLRVDDETVVLGYKPYTPAPKVQYYLCKDEEELLSRLLEIWSKMAPDIVTGWNVEFFDVPYIVNRIKRILGEKAALRLSPWGILEDRKIYTRGREHTVYSPVGISVLDYLQLYTKFSYKMQESYRLDHIAHVELGERKLDYSEFSSLNELYEGDYQKFIDYNVKDVDLVYALDAKMKFIEQVMTIAYSGKVNYLDTFTSVRMWDIIIHNYLMEQKIVVPQNEFREKDEQITGAYVKDPHVGMHKCVASFDVNSLYPKLIEQYNISPETLVGKMDKTFTVDDALDGHYNKPEVRDFLNSQNLTLAANGALFLRSKRGFLPKLMAKLYDERILFKDKMIEANKTLQLIEKGEYTEPGLTKIELKKKFAALSAQYNNNQMARKIILNSGYGALSNAGFRYYDDTLAEAITISGQLSIRWIENTLNRYMNKMLRTDNKDYIIAVDTDSNYLCLSDIVDQVFTAEEQKDINKIINFMDKVCKEKIEPLIDKAFDELAVYANVYAQQMKMKRENLADKAIWVAKKRYIMNVWDSEGVRYAAPKLKMMGIEAVKTSTPAACRDVIKSTLNLVMTTDEQTVIEHIEKFRANFRKLPFEDIAFPRGCKDSSKWIDRSSIYKKATPIHVKGALLYNHYLKMNKLDTKYPLISDGEKVKYSYLKLPNPIQDSVIASPSGLPVELGLDRYIDYDTQFEKSFLAPVKSILDKIGWKSDNKPTLEAFL